MKTLYERNAPQKVGTRLRPLTVLNEKFPEIFKRKTLIDIPHISEPELIAYFAECARETIGIIDLFPLGSCTMKHNPKQNLRYQLLPGFADIHPLMPEGSVQGALELQFRLLDMLASLSGLAAGTLEPPAGASSEFGACLMIKKYFRERGEGGRIKVLMPDVAHGTNPASAAMAGFDVVSLPTDNGDIDLVELKKVLDKTVACFMITYPSTLGIPESHLEEIVAMVHEVGAFVYMDGANFNALVGRWRPGSHGIDLMHMNFHKTFATPHGGGGPGAGFIGCTKLFEPYLPMPVVVKKGGVYQFDFDRPHSIGKLHTYFGNFGIDVQAYAYLRSNGNDIHLVADTTNANAQYAKKLLLDEKFVIIGAERALHEFVLDLKPILDATGVTLEDFCKRILDFGFHAPTMGFPVHTGLLIETPESATRESIEELVRVLKTIRDECFTDPAVVKSAPHKTSVGRVDNARGDRDLLQWSKTP
ncbi:MAG: aminomethyl-transferring glycine dehydrogenase subunit GcvPB [bacterium]|nr:aminomethyl-transferring glycine dehydrogenase subunit GcvPB [bacterium]